MRQTGRAAVAKVSLREKEHLCLVRLIGDTLSVALMFFRDEIRSTAELGIAELAEKVQVRPEEMEMAVKLVENLTAAFSPEKYHDAYREELLAYTGQSGGARIRGAGSSGAPGRECGGPHGAAPPERRGDDKSRNPRRNRPQGSAGRGQLNRRNDLPRGIHRCEKVSYILHALFDIAHGKLRRYAFLQFLPRYGRGDVGVWRCPHTVG